MLRTRKIEFFTYQLKTERAFKVVIRHLHHSIDINDIKEALKSEGHEVRSIINIRHWRTKEPLPLFFVSLEPKDNNKEVYDLKVLLHTRIQVESPKPRPDVLQCMRCQRFGHSKAYCTLAYVCVKCGDNHDNRECPKKPTDKPKCGLCGGDHTANYRGCSVYKSLSLVSQKKAHNQQARSRINPTIDQLGTTQHQGSKQTTSYANKYKAHHHCSQLACHLLTKILTPSPVAAWKSCLKNFSSKMSESWICYSNYQLVYDGISQYAFSPTSNAAYSYLECKWTPSQAGRTCTIPQSREDRYSPHLRNTPHHPCKSGNPWL